MRTMSLRSTSTRLAAGAFALVLTTSLAPAAEQRHPLVGSWKLLSWQVVTEAGAAQDIFGASPKGYLVLTPEGRSIVLTTAGNRKSGMADEARAALHKSMLSYTGHYRVEGNDFITTVELSWNEEWNGTEQRRHYRIDGEKLFIESAPAPSIVFPGKTDFRRIVWVREK
jgi:hypothetical protein